MDEQMLSIPLVVMVIMELLKYAVRAYYKDPSKDLPPLFYETLIPFFTFVVGWGFGLLGWAEPISATPDYVIRWAIGILLTLAMYYLGLQPFKAYRKEYFLQKSEDEASKQDVG
jgi:hypothetical protein